MIFSALKLIIPNQSNSLVAYHERMDVNDHHVEIQPPVIPLIEMFLDFVASL